jgi:hypothetical protein
LSARKAIIEGGTGNLTPRQNYTSSFWEPNLRRGGQQHSFVHQLRRQFGIDAAKLNKGLFSVSVIALARLRYLLHRSRLAYKAEDV